MIDPVRPSSDEFDADSVDGGPPAATPSHVDEPALFVAGAAEPSPVDPSVVSGVAPGVDSADADQRDVAAALRGDDEAFARLYDRHAAIVLAVCRRGSGVGASDPAEADDAMQETFIRAHRQLATLAEPHRLRGWLLGIARRVCSERRRATGRRRRHEEEAMTRRLHEAGLDTAHSGGAASASRGSMTGAGAAEAESLARLDAALDRLPESERLAIHLFYLDVDPIRAASDELGLSRSGFYKLLARARQRLRELMDDTPGDELAIGSPTT